MADLTLETIPNLLLKNLSRELILSVDESLNVGAQRAHQAARGMDNGHMPHVMGQMRHFHMNETFHGALVAANASPSPIKGNKLVIGRAGILTLGRFNAYENSLRQARLSTLRRDLAKLNGAIGGLIQPKIFGEFYPPTEAVVFFVSRFSGYSRIQSEVPASIYIAVPDEQLRSWLFRESLDAFLKRYDETSETQVDIAVPKLKKALGKQLDGFGTTK